MNLESEIVQINLDDIIPNRFQPRLNFDDAALNELAESIKQHGLIQPLVLRKIGDKYEIIAGERRFKAANIAGFKKIPAIISNIDDEKSAELAIVENVQRKDLTPIEEAFSYSKLRENGNLTQEQLATKLGISQSAVANKLRLLNLDEEVQKALLNEQISERHARSLLQIPDKNEQKNMLNRILSERLTVRQLDEEIKKIYAEEDEEDIPIVQINPNIEDIKSNAMDINPIKEQKNIDNLMQTENINEEEKPSSEIIKQQNRFFNFLEDEPTNMSMETANEEFVSPFEDKTKKVEEQQIEEPSEIIEPVEVEKVVEVAPDIISTPETNIFSTPAPITVEEEPEVLITEQKPEVLNFSNEVESLEPSKPTNLFDSVEVEKPIDTFISPFANENIVDPVNIIDTLNNKEEVPKVSDNKELISAINIMRDAASKVENLGFVVDTEEIDFNELYQINIKIQK